jgi:quercetin dioxygenase-like cupin family protein
MLRRRQATALALTAGLLMASGPAQGDENKAERLLRSELDGHKLFVQRIELPPGGTSAAHGHDGHEIVYLLEGAITVVLDGQTASYRSGQLFHVTPGTVMSASNPSQTGPTRLLVFYLVEQ